MDHTRKSVTSSLVIPLTYYLSFNILILINYIKILKICHSFSIAYSDSRFVLINSRFLKVSASSSVSSSSFSSYCCITVSEPGSGT